MSAAAILDIPIVIDRHPSDRGRAGRRREPITFGVPLPAGAARDADGWQLVGDGGLVTGVQTKVLDRWPDGSIRWLLVDSQVDVPPGGGTRSQLRWSKSEAAGSAPASVLAIADTASGVSIDTGAAQFGIHAGGGFPFEGATLGLTSQSGIEQRVTVSRVSIRERGPLRASISVEGAVAAGPLAELDVLARLDFYAGSAATRISVRLRNPRRAEHRDGFWDLGDSGSLLIKDASLTVQMPSGHGDRVDIRCSPEIGAPWAGTDGPVELYQDSSGGDNWQSHAHMNRERRVPNTFRGYRLRSGSTETTGLRATPAVAVRCGATHFAMAVPHFWQNFPKAIEASAEGITFRLFPHQYADVHELQGGEQKTHVCFVSMGTGAPEVDALDWCRTPVTARADSAWSLSTGAVPWLGPDEADHEALVRSAVEGPDTFERKREAVDEYGWRHFGDVYGDHEAVRHTGPEPLVSHYNNQYDTIAGFIYQYLRSGDPRWWSMTTELASHVTDIDVYHTARDKWAYNHGLFWHTYHYGDADTSTHRIYPRIAKGVIHGGGPAPDHNYTTGLMLHHFLTGDVTSRETAIDLAQFVIDNDDGNKTVLRWLSRANTGFATASGSYDYHGPGRGPGNSLNALVDGHRLSGEPRFLEKAEQIIRRVVHPQEDISSHGLDDPENKWFYLMFLQSLGKYLWYKAELRQLDAMYDYGRASLIHYARWMAENEYPYLERPEKLHFPTETWAAQEIRKSDVFYLASLHTDGAERARFIERGQFFFKNSIDTLQRMPTRSCARPVIVLSSSGLMHPWCEARPDAAAPAPTHPAREFAPKAPFLPQKREAVKRFKILAIGGGAILIGLTTLAVYWALSH